MVDSLPRGSQGHVYPIWLTMAWRWCRIRNNIWMSDMHVHIDILCNMLWFIWNIIIFLCRMISYSGYSHLMISAATQRARFLGPTWGPSGSCLPQMGPMLAPWTSLSGYACCLLTMHHNWNWPHFIDIKQFWWITLIMNILFQSFVYGIRHKLVSREAIPYCASS